MKPPLHSGLLKYFPDALKTVALVSQWGNDKHNPGEPLHWAREKSTGHLDSATRHILNAGTLDEESQLPHLAHAAWRILAALQTEIENDLHKRED